jgi:hypothetical protein
MMFGFQNNRLQALEERIASLENECKVLRALVNGQEEVGKKVAESLKQVKEASMIKRYCFTSTLTWKVYEHHLVSDVVEMILDHLGLTLKEQPATEKKILLVKRAKAK